MFVFVVDCTVEFIRLQPQQAKLHLLVPVDPTAGLCMSVCSCQKLCFQLDSVSTGILFIALPVFLFRLAVIFFL